MSERSPNLFANTFALAFDSRKMEKFDAAWAEKFVKFLNFPRSVFVRFHPICRELQKKVDNQKCRVHSIW